MNDWESYVKNLIKKINEDADAVVLGVTGSKVIQKRLTK